MKEMEGKAQHDGLEMQSAYNKNKYALVTGATSGIGYELAKKLASNGYNLVIVARDNDQLEKVSNELSQFNIEVIRINEDLFNENAPNEIYDLIRTRGINIDVLINDAGQGEYGKFVETDLERQLDIIRLNISSLVALTHLFLSDMVKRDSGKILQLGSEVSKIPTPLMAVYAATKSFVLSFTEALIQELEGTNVTMTLVMPGATDTDFFHKAGMEESRTYREGKFESPEEVAEVAYEALMDGERRIIAGNAKMNVAMAAVTPDHINAKKLGKKMKPSGKSSGKRNPEHKQSLREKKNVHLDK